MTYYLKHLFALYVSYMKLALIGVVVSAFTLLLYAAFKTNNPGSGLAILGGFFGVLIGMISVQRNRWRSASRRREAEAKWERGRREWERGRERVWLAVAKSLKSTKAASAEENAPAGVSGKKLAATHQEGDNKVAR